MALQLSLLVALFFSAAAGSVTGSATCDCEAQCGQVVAHHRERIAQLEAEIRELRGTAAARRAAAQAAHCVGDEWVITSSADAAARQGCHTARNITIEAGDTAISLASLVSLERAEAIFIRNNKRLQNLAGLENLASVQRLEIIDNLRLSSLEALRALRTAEVIYLDSNDRLSSLAGLEGLEDVKRFEIFRHAKLESLAQFENLTSLDVLSIEDNYGDLEGLYGFERLVRVDTLRMIDNNLRSLSGLQGLQTVRELRIEDNFILHDASTGLENLVSADVLRVTGMQGLHFLGRNVSLVLTSLTTVREDLTVGELSFVHLPSLQTAKEIHLVNVGTVTGLQSLTRVDVLKGKFRDAETLPFNSLMSVGVLEVTNSPRLQSLGLPRLTNVGDFVIQGNAELRSLSGSLQSATQLSIVDNALLGGVALESLQDVLYELRVANCPRLSSLDGLERLRSVDALSLMNLQGLESLAGLRGLANAWGRVTIQNCNLRSLEGLGDLSTPLLLVEESHLTYLGGPFAARGATAGVIRFDAASWPLCITAHERAALASHVETAERSVIPEVTEWQEEQCGKSLGTFSCTRGHPCNFSLGGRPSNDTSIFITARFTGCGLCTGDRPQGKVMEDGMVDLGFALNGEEGGLHSVCRCTGWGKLGPLAQLLLRGPRHSGTTVCRSGLNCAVNLEGEQLEPTDRVVLMNDCSTGNPLSGFEARWTATNAYLLDDPATWYMAPRTRYQVCWMAPCSFTVDSPTCPEPEDSYLSAGEVELIGVYTRSYSVILGENFSAPNIGFGALDGDWMRLRRTCGEANDEGTDDVLDASSSRLLFDFGRLSEDRVGAGNYHLCWCQEGDGHWCNAERDFLAVCGDVRILCPRGQGFVASSNRCQQCPAGRQKLQEGLEECSECRSGRASPGNGETCEVCEEGMVAALAGSSACVFCRSWETADAEAASCSADPAMLVLLLSFCLSAGTFSALLVQTTRKQLTVVDVSIDQKCTIISTFGSHGFSNFGHKSFPVMFHDTGHPGLDNPGEPFRARVRDAAHMELLTWKGESIDRRLDTSMGALVVAFPHNLYHQGWPVPVFFGLPVLFSVAAALGAMVLEVGMTAEGLLGAAATVLTFTVASAVVRWRPRATPLAQRVSAFQAKLAEQPPTLCEKGPQRALAVGKLHALLLHFRDFIRDRTAYYVDSNIIRPLCKEAQVSYAELVGAAEVEWFVSHFWGTAFEHFCMALQKHAEMVCGEREWTSLRYWVCFCSNNQYKIKEELGAGWAESSFFLTLKSGKCNGTCMVLDDQAMPLTRVWCIFELLQTVKLKREAEIFQGLLLCTSGGVVNTGNGSVEVAMALARKVADMDLEAAQASSESDADMIRQQVLLEMGSYAALNHFIRGEVRHMLVRAQASANQQFAAVIAHLNENEAELQVAV